MRGNGGLQRTEGFHLMEMAGKFKDDHITAGDGRYVAGTHKFHQGGFIPFTGVQMADNQRLRVKGASKSSFHPFTS